MHRFYLAPEQCAPPTLFLGGREAHHAIHVLRLRRGDNLVVLDGAGHEYLCRVENYDRDKLQARVEDETFTAPPLFQVSLLQALPKGKLIESIIQKGTELGMHRLVPLCTERVVAQIKTSEAAQKQLKWQQVAVEAIKQCGARWLPRIDAPCTLAEWLARKESFDLPLVGSLHGQSRHPRAWFRNYHARHGRTPRSVAFFIGPEGDFTAAEVEGLQAAGALPITLGPLVLRTDTASAYCLSVAQYEMQWAVEESPPGPAESVDTR